MSDSTVLVRLEQQLDALDEPGALSSCAALLRAQAGHDGFVLRYITARAPGAGETRAVLRAYIHDPAGDVALRALAISLFAGVEPPLLHVDLIMLLADPAQPVALRCEALDQVGGYRVRACAPAVHEVLRHAADDALIFWCLYALGSLRYAPALGEIQAYLDDQTVIAPYGRIADEARYTFDAIALLDGGGEGEGDGEGEDEEA